MVGATMTKECNATQPSLILFWRVAAVAGCWAGMIAGRGVPVLRDVQYPPR